MDKMKIIEILANEIAERESTDHDVDLFKCGFDSIAILQLIGKIRDETGKEVPLKAIGEHTTIRSLAEHI